MKKYEFIIEKNESNEHLLELEKYLNLNVDVDNGTDYPNQTKMMICGKLLVKHVNTNDLNSVFCLIKLFNTGVSYLSGGALHDLLLWKLVLDYLHNNLPEGTYIGRTSIGVVVHMYGEDVEAKLLTLLNGFTQELEANTYLKNANCDFYNMNLKAQIGYALYPEDISNTTSFTDISKCVAIAASDLDNDKGWSKIRRFTSALEVKMEETLKVEDALIESIITEKFDMFYQPQVELATGKIIGVEALVRWNNKTLCPSNSYEYVKIIEKGCYLPRFTKVTFNKLTEFIGKYQEVLPDDFKFGYNLSPAIFSSTEFDVVQMVMEKIIENKKLKKQLIFEITESAYVDNTMVENLIESLAKLRALGIRISIDDFGSGNTSLRLLTSNLPNAIKLDMHITHEYCQQSSKKSYISSLINLAISSNLSVVCEGIETEKQRNILIRRGVRHGQGYLFSKPLTEYQFLSHYQQIIAVADASIV